VVLASVLLSLAATELILRLGGWAAEPVREHARLLRYDPTIGWTKISDGSVVYRFASERVHETSNSFGGRGPELNPDGQRVLFLGDSFCEGYLVGDDHVFSYALQKLMPALQLINLGVVGYSTDQELLTYEQAQPRLNPQLVVVLFFDNDVWFNAVTQEYRAKKPMFEMTDTGLRLIGTPVPRPDPKVAAAPCADCLSSPRLLWLLDRARLRLSAGPSASSGNPSIPAEMQMYRRTQPPEMENSWKLTAALLQRLRESTSDRLAIFYVPTVAAIYDTSWEQTKRVYGMDDQWDIHLAETRLAEICERLGIPLISPTTRFRESALRGETLYFMQDGHWNAAGHKLVADILAQYLSHWAK
jgi:GDSL-like Lipase/Acylhydrolase family